MPRRRRRLSALSETEVRDRYRRLKRARLAVGGLLFVAGAGLAFLRTQVRRHAISDQTWWLGLALVMVLAVLGIAWTRARWRCPSCRGSFWGRRTPTICPYCRVPLI